MVEPAAARKSSRNRRQREFFAPYLSEISVEEMEMDALYDLQAKYMKGGLALPWW